MDVLDRNGSLGLPPVASEWQMHTFMIHIRVDNTKGENQGKPTFVYFEHVYVLKH